VLSQLGRPGEAVEALRQLLFFQPDNHDALGALGWYAYQAGQLAESIVASKAALELNPHADMVAFNLGLANLARGKQESAVVTYTRALSSIERLEPEKQQAAKTAAMTDLSDLLTTHPEHEISARLLIQLIRGESPATS